MDPSILHWVFRLPHNHVLAAADVDFAWHRSTNPSSAAALCIYDGQCLGLVATADTIRQPQMFILCIRGWASNSTYLQLLPSWSLRAASQSTHIEANSLTARAGALLVPLYELLVAWRIGIQTFESTCSAYWIRARIAAWLLSPAVWLSECAIARQLNVGSNSIANAVVYR